MSPPAIELRGVGKRYWKIEERSLIRSLMPLKTPNRSELWALHDVSLQVGVGETVGILGVNGAGKSTLLRLLAGVTQPTVGSLVIRGRIAPLLSVGIGFHPEMTGRENVYVNGRLLGFGKSQIESLFSDIVDFADLADFIDTPVKFYSSGMYMRLGFSVAIHVDPDVLLVDEVLSVGDVAFRVRSLDRMRAMQRAGTALVFVSHIMQVVQMLCPRAICIDHGRVEFDGPTEAAIARYHQLLPTAVDDHRPGSVRVLHRELVASDGLPVGAVHPDDLLTYRVKLRFEERLENPQVQFRVIAEDSTLAYAVQTGFDDSFRSYNAGEEASVAVIFRPRFGQGGTFQPAILVTNGDGSATFLHDHAGPSFFVAPRLGVFGVTDLRASVVVDGERRTSSGRSLRMETTPAGTSADGVETTPDR
jgi:ABC-type polysaccharide/polyol phosphate transport system ATPase subunit